MNLMKWAIWNDSQALSMIRCAVNPVIECSNITQSAGKTSEAIAKKSSLSAVSRLCAMLRDAGV
jgi:hypothetical protein